MGVQIPPPAKRQKIMAKGRDKGRDQKGGKKKKKKRKKVKEEKKPRRWHSSDGRASGTCIKNAYLVQW